MKFDKTVRLRSSLFFGEGEVDLKPEWYELNPLLRADILRDWIYEMGCLYSDAMQEMGRPYETTLQIVKVDYDNS